MKASELTKDQNQTYTENQPTQINSKVKVVLVVTIIVALLIAVIAGLLGYYLGSSRKGSFSGVEKESPSESPSPSPTPSQSPAPQSSDKMKTYKDPEGRFTFRYPSNWILLDEVPEKYKLGQGSGKMIRQNCNGPMLQNASDPDQLIVFEVIRVGSEGEGCLAIGAYSPDGKWKLTEQSGWKGDYMIMRLVNGSNAYKVRATLINYETFELRGEEDFNAIIETFQFTE